MIFFVSSADRGNSMQCLLSSLRAPSESQTPAHIFFNRQSCADCRQSQWIMLCFYNTKHQTPISSEPGIYTASSFSLEYLKHVLCRFRLNAVDELQQSRDKRTIFAKWKMRTPCESSPEVRIYEPGLHLPIEIILSTGCVIEHMHRMRQTGV